MILSCQITCRNYLSVRAWWVVLRTQYYYNYVIIIIICNIVLYLILYYLCNILSMAHTKMYNLPRSTVMQYLSDTWRSRRWSLFFSEGYPAGYLPCVSTHLHCCTCVVHSKPCKFYSAYFCSGRMPIPEKSTVKGRYNNLFEWSKAVYCRKKICHSLYR